MKVLQGVGLEYLRWEMVASLAESGQGLTDR